MTMNVSTQIHTFTGKIHTFKFQFQIQFEVLHIDINVEWVRLTSKPKLEINKTVKTELTFNF